MPKTTLYPSDFYMSPAFVFLRFQSLIEKHGEEAALTENRFKAEREAWVSALFALGIMKQSNQEHWVGINPDDSTPDTYAVRFPEKEYKGRKALAREIINLEIFEWEDHSKLSLEQAFEEKMSEKAYPEYMNLLCYAHSRPGELIELRKLSEFIQSKNYPIGDIWLLANLQDDSGKLDMYLLTRLSNQPFQVEFSRGEETKNHKGQKEMIETSLGISREMRHLGEKYLPLPD